MLFLAVIETVAIGHVYGGEKFMEDIKLMIGYRVPNAFKYCIMYVTPSLTTVSPTMLFLAVKKQFSIGLVTCVG